MRESVSGESDSDVGFVSMICVYPSSRVTRQTNTEPDSLRIRWESFGSGETLHSVASGFDLTFSNCRITMYAAIGTHDPAIIECVYELLEIVSDVSISVLCWSTEDV